MHTIDRIENDKKIKILRERETSSQLRLNELKKAREGLKRRHHGISIEYVHIKHYAPFQEPEIQKTSRPFVPNFRKTVIEKNIDELENRIKAMSEKLQEAENALKEEKQKGEQEILAKDKQLQELKEFYEQKLKGTTDTIYT